MGAGRRAIWRLSRLELARPIAHASPTRHGPLPPVLRSRHLLQLPTADQPAEPSARTRHAHTVSDGQVPEPGRAEAMGAVGFIAKLGRVVPDRRRCAHRSPDVVSTAKVAAGRGTAAPL